MGRVVGPQFLVAPMIGSHYRCPARKESPPMIVRQCREQDLARLEHHIPTGRNRTHDTRYRRQSEGLHGVRHEVADPCRFLIKAVSGASG
jgi:hypothetical protein